MPDMKSTSIPPAAKFTPINRPSTKGMINDANKVLHADTDLRAPKRARTMPAPMDSVDDQFQRSAASGNLTSGLKEGRQVNVTSNTRRHNATSKFKRSRITDRMQVVKGLNNSGYYAIYKTSDQTLEPRNSDSVNYQGKLDAFKHRMLDLPEPQTSLLSPITSVSTLESSPGIGCSVYDTRDRDVEPTASPSFGPKINRVLSRTLSPDPTPRTRKRTKGLKDRSTLATEVSEVSEEDSNAPILSTMSSGAIPTNFFSDAIACMSELEGKDCGESWLGTDSNRISSPCPLQVRPFERDVGMMNFVDDDDDDDDDDCFMLDEDDVAELEQLARSMEQKTNTNSGISHQKVRHMLSPRTFDEGRMVGTEELIKTMQGPTKKIHPMAGVPHHQVKGVPQQLNEVITLGEDAQVFPTSTSGNTSSTWERSSKPIVRKPFPEQIKDRSPVIAISGNTVLRTCFRVGEALNTGCQAARLGRHVVLELYARVKSSWREERATQQDFMFSDLYHDNPPFMNGVYENYKGASEREEESARFLNADENEQLCRVVGTMRRKDGSKWEIVVLNVREVSWADIEYIAGIHS